MLKNILVHVPITYALSIKKFYNFRTWAPGNTMGGMGVFFQTIGIQGLMMDVNQEKKVSSYVNLYATLYGPRSDKTCLWGFQQSEPQTSLLSYRD